MIEQKQLLSINYYKKGKPFTGSDTGMRYRIAKTVGEGEDDAFLISVWEEPFCYEATDKEKIIEKKVPYTKEEFLKIADYLNSMHDVVGKRLT